jgi:hypothetical protein
VVGVAGDDVPVQKPRGKELVPHTLWGEIAIQVGGPALYAEVEAEVEPPAAPGKPYFETSNQTSSLPLCSRRAYSRFAHKPFSSLFLRPVFYHQTIPQPAFVDAQLHPRVRMSACSTFPCPCKNCNQSSAPSALWHPHAQVTLLKRLRCGRLPFSDASAIVRIVRMRTHCGRLRFSNRPQTAGCANPELPRDISALDGFCGRCGQCGRLFAFLRDRE